MGAMVLLIDAIIFQVLLYVSRDEPSCGAAFPI